MRKVNKIFASLLAAAMLFSVTACSSNGTPKETTEAGSEGGASAVKTMDSATLQKIQDDKEKKEGYLVIDVRSEEEYKAGHVKFAIHMPVETIGDNLSAIEDWKDKPVVLVCNSGKKSGEAADILVENGFTDVTNAEGVKDGGYNLVTWGNIRGTELQKIGDEGQVLIVDLRDAADYEAGHFKTAVNAVAEEMSGVEAQLPADKNAMIVTHCYSGNRSAVAAQALVDMGYTNVYNCLDGAKEVEYVFDGTAQPGTEAAGENAGAEAADQKTVFVTPEWVKSVIDGEQKESENYVILECAWGEAADDPAYQEGHIKGAFHMNTDSVEEEEYWNIRTPEEIEALAAQYGITKDTTVICYGDSGKNSADDRVAFVFLWAGVENVKCLDGGFEAWTKAGYETETGVNEPTATEEAFGVTVPAHPEYVLSIDEVRTKLESDDNFKLVSIRSEAEFTGETSGYGYIDRAGEPEGAIWGHDTDDGSYNNADGTTVNADTLEGYLAESDASMDNELSFYCGTGWRACIPFLICYEEGYTNVSLYDGGWFQWQMDSALPVQVGDPDSEDCVHTTVGELSADKAAK